MRLEVEALDEPTSNIEEGDEQREVLGELEITARLDHGRRGNVIARG
jgi:hypothetical protein